MCDSIQRRGSSIQAVLYDHTDRERETYVHDLLCQGSDKTKNTGSDQDVQNESHEEIDLARQLINIAERSSIGRNAPLGMSCTNTSYQTADHTTNDPLIHPFTHYS